MASGQKESGQLLPQGAKILPPLDLGQPVIIPARVEPIKFAATHGSTGGKLSKLGEQGEDKQITHGTGCP